MNVSHLLEAQLQEQIQKMWSEEECKVTITGAGAAEMLKHRLHKATKITRSWGKRRAVEQCQCTILLQEKFAKAQLLVHREPESAAAQDKFHQASLDLREQNLKQVKWQEETMQTTWIVNGNRCSRPFFCTFKSIAVSTAIDEVLDASGHAVSTWEEIAGAAVAHYTNILGKSEEMDPQAIRQILNVQTEVITEADQESMEAEITIDELYKAAKAIGQNKCPGEDGTPVEFFVCNWQVVGSTLHRALQEGIRSGRLDPIFTKGYLVLLSKQGDPRLFSNKRPLTMLNALYKIAAKAFQLRLTKVLKNFITAQQSAFIPRRSIHHSVLLMSKLVLHANKSGLEHILLKLDMKKAYDMVEWEFLHLLLTKYGFGPNFLQFLQAAQATQSSAVRVNGQLSLYFPNQRSLCQGCP